MLITSSDKQIHARVSMLHHYMEGKPLKVRLYDGTAEITLTVFGNQARKFETVMKVRRILACIELNFFYFDVIRLIPSLLDLLHLD